MRHKPGFYEIVQCSQAQPQTKSSRQASAIATSEQATAFQTGLGQHYGTSGREWVARGVTVWTPQEPNCHTLSKGGLTHFSRHPEWQHQAITCPP